MFKLKIRNNNDAVLDLSQNEENYQILKISGLTPPKAVISSSPLVNMDGEKFKNSRLDTRNIVINLKINGNIEENRLALYEFFDTGKELEIMFQNDTRNVYINGYCENIDCDLFSSRQEAQISIVCLNPFWKNINKETTNISQTFDNFVFPFAIPKEGIAFSDFYVDKETEIVNKGEIEIGMIIHLTTTGETVSNPVIYNSKTGEFLRINTTIYDYEEIIINTNKGEKSLIKISDGIMTNIINDLDLGSTWLQLRKGMNTFTYQSIENQDSLRITVEYNIEYKGV